MSILNVIANHWDDIAAGAMLVGGYLFHRGGKVADQSLKKLASSLAKQALPRLLRDPRVHDDAYIRKVIAGAIWAGIDRLGIKHSAALQKLAAEAVEHAAGELCAKVIDYQLGQFIATQEKTLDVIKAAPGDQPLNATP